MKYCPYCDSTKIVVYPETPLVMTQTARGLFVKSMRLSDIKDIDGDVLMSCNDCTAEFSANMVRSVKRRARTSNLHRWKTTCKIADINPRDDSPA